MTTSANQTTTYYPKTKVILTYTLLGGMLGGLVFDMGALVFIAFEFLRYQHISLALSSTFDALIGGLIFMVFGGILGMPSAFLTGLIISINKLTIGSYKDYFKFCAIGAGSGAITGLLISLLAFLLMNNNGFDVSVTLFSMLIFTGIGGVTSVILGRLAVPKVKK